MLAFDVNDSLLSFGPLSLTGLSDDGQYELRLLGSAAGTNMTSAPEPVTATMQSFLQDGAIVATTGHDNRTLPVYVQVLDGPNADPGGGIPQGEAALVEQCRATWGGAIVPLRWLPAVGFGPPCVFQCTAAALSEPDWDDLEERFPDTKGTVYLLTLTCNPWAFADTAVTETIAATAGTTPTVTSINDCSSTTGWTLPGTASSGTIGGDTYVRSTSTSGSAAASLDGLSIDMSSTPYLQVSVVFEKLSGGSWVPNPGGKVDAGDPDGNLLFPQLAAVAGNTRWYALSGTLGHLGFGSVADGARVTVFDVSRTDALPAGKQVYRQFDVQGSVRTPASIAVRGVDVSDDSDAALGQTLVYTTRSSSAFTPALRGYLQSGPTETADTTAYSGKSSPLSTTHDFRMDAASVADAGYLLVARVKATSTGTKSVTWTADTLQGGSAVDTAITGTTSVTIAAANTWQLVTIANLRLPETQVGSAGQVRVQLDSTTLTLDDAWLFDLDHGQVSILDTGDSTYAWLDAPTFTNPKPMITVGTESDRSDSYMPGPNIAAFGSHEVVGGEVVNVFVASGNPPEVSLTYTPAGHTRAPKVA